MAGEDDKLLPISDEALTDSLAFALRFNGRKRFHRGDEFMADLTAQHLVEHLRRCGYVFMVKPTELRTGEQWPGARKGSRRE